MSDRQTPTAPERSFAWGDMFVHPDDDPRSHGGPFDDERDMSLADLNDQRLTLQDARHLGHADFLRERIDGRVDE